MESSSCFNHNFHDIAAGTEHWVGRRDHVFVTPLAYTAQSPKDGFGKPLVAFHYLNGGVLGDFL